MQPEICHLKFDNRTFYVAYSKKAVSKNKDASKNSPAFLKIRTEISAI